MILTDVLKRWQQLKGRKALLCTGTDEHGMKIQQAAAKTMTEPQLFCDKGAEVFKDLGASVQMSHDYFMRTTDQRHKDAVEYAWQMLEDKGFIYESSHQGWYSVSDETFYPSAQVHLIVDPPTGRKIHVSIETGSEVEWQSERNYHFRLSAFEDRLLAWYKDNPDWIVPRSRMEHVVSEVSAGLEDLSVSRPSGRLQWGIRVPTDSSQTIYVWLDALLNYASAAGYPFKTPGYETEGGWPADVHVVGKDIVRFHCIYWPAFLMALDLPLPKQILTHAHWTLGRQKMAKSTGNVVNPFFALERFGSETMRYYLVRDGGITDDADYDNRRIIERYKKSLQGGLGNLVSRIMRGKGWDVPRAVGKFARDSSSKNWKSSALGRAIDNDTARFHGRLRTLPSKTDQHMRDLHPNRALQALEKAVSDANGELQRLSPWTIVTQLKSIVADTTGNELHELSQRGLSPERLEEQVDSIVFLSAETLRLVGIQLRPFMPETSARLLDMLGVSEERRGWEWCQLGCDDGYGTPLVELGKGEEGVLFPSLLSDF
ncbi:hypothetical protein MBLNU230_g8664t1 [Neophaeotheca triangularis]